MSTGNKVYVGDTGTEVLVDCGQDVSAGSLFQLSVTRPDGSSATWTAALQGTNFVRFLSLAGTFDQPGLWKLQALVTLPSGVWRGETAQFLVYSNFE